jgi:hypothetical protein
MDVYVVAGQYEIQIAENRNLLSHYLMCNIFRRDGILSRSGGGEGEKQGAIRRVGWEGKHLDVELIDDATC